MEKRTAGILAICAAAILWGLDGVALTPRLFTLDAAFVVFLIHALPFVLMQPFLFPAWRKLTALTPRGWVSLILVATLSGALGTLAIVKALFLVQFNHLSVVVLLQKLQPIFAIVLARIVLDEEMGERFYLWTGLALIGVYLLTFGFDVPRFDAGVQAALLAIVAAACFGAGTVLSKRLLQDTDFATATFGRFGVTAAIMLLFLLVTGTGFAFGAVSHAQWLLLLLIAVTSGGGGIFLYYYGLRRVPASVSTICELCMPLSALLFDYLLNGTTLSVGQLIGTVILLGAIVKISFLHEAMRAAKKSASKQ